MDPQSERWPHVDIVRAELHQLQAEQTAAIAKARTQHFIALKLAMSGYDKTLNRIRRRTIMRTFTQRMLNYGEKVLNERRQNGGTIPD